MRRRTTIRNKGLTKYKALDLARKVGYNLFLSPTWKFKNCLNDYKYMLENAIEKLGYTVTGKFPSISITIRREAEKRVISSKLTTKRQLELILNEHWQFETVINPQLDKVLIKAVYVYNGKQQEFFIPENLTKD